MPSVSLASATVPPGLERSHQNINPFLINDIHYLYSVGTALDFIPSKDLVESCQAAGPVGGWSIATPLPYWKPSPDFSTPAPHEGMRPTTLVGTKHPQCFVPHPANDIPQKHSVSDLPDGEKSGLDDNISVE